MASQLTVDLKEIVTKVTGQTAHKVFNDKRKSFERRLKFSGVLDVSPKKVRKIAKKISKKYPDLQFVVKSDYVIPSKSSYEHSMQHYKGLTVKVF
jgi:hypothetical protein